MPRVGHHDNAITVDNGEDEFWNEEKDKFIVVALDEDCETRKFIQREKWYGCIKLLRTVGPAAADRTRGEDGRAVVIGRIPTRRNSQSERRTQTPEMRCSSREEVNDSGERCLLLACVSNCSVIWNIKILNICFQYTIPMNNSWEIFETKLTTRHDKTCTLGRTD